MRYVLRDSELAPEILFEDEIRDSVKHFAKGSPEINIRGRLYRIQERITPHLLAAVKLQFLNKCAYCESPINDYPSVDWFRPPMGADRGKGQVDQNHYSWLVAEWNNIYLCCPECSNYKRNLFPIEKRGQFGAPLIRLQYEERAQLIDPCLDSPEQHLTIGNDGYLIPITARGRATVDILNLNRPDLCFARQKSVDYFVGLWNAEIYSAEQDEDGKARLPLRLKSVFEAGASFVGAVQLYLWKVSTQAQKRILRRIARQGDYSRHIGKLVSLGILPVLNELPINQISEEEGRAFQHEDFPTYRPIKALQISGFKGIEDIFIEFPVLPKGAEAAMAIVGQNAAGKSSVLQALALVLIGPQAACTVVRDATKLLAFGKNHAFIKVEFWGTGEANTLTISRSSSRFGGIAQRPVRVYGYGPYRLLAKRELGSAKRQKSYRLTSLFDDGQKLNGYHGWLDRLNEKQRHDMAEVLELLLASESTTVQVEARTINIKTTDKIHPIDSLSSGMQSIVSMCTDLMEAIYSQGESVLAQGFVVIVDELDAHLHPAWRIGIANRLNRAFPNAHIIFSTHDPLALRGLESEQLQILYRDENGHTKNKRADRYSDSLDIDQILTSEIFGLFSTHSTEWETDFKDYYRLLSQNEKSGNLSTADAAKLQILRNRLEGFGVFGKTRRERMMYAVIDQFLATPVTPPNEWDPEIIRRLAAQIQENLDSLERGK